MTSLLERVSSQRPGYWDSPFTPEMIAQVAVLGGPSLSPDGRHIVYVRDHNYRADLWVMPSSGGHARLVSADAPASNVGNNTPFSGGFGGGVAWSSDSSAIVYTSPRDGKLYRVSSGGGRAERVSDGVGSHIGPQLAPNDAFVVYCVDRGDVDDQIFVAKQDLDASTPNTRRLTPGNVVALDPQVAPDGRRVACVFFPINGRWAHDAQIAVMDLSSDAINVLTPTDDVVNVTPRWSPDGTKLAFTSDRNGYLNVHIVPATGGPSVALAPERFEQTQPTWSSDGRYIAYLRNEQASVHVMVVELASGVTRCVSRQFGVHSALSWSPDGEALFALHQSPCHAPDIIEYRLDGSQHRQLTHSAPGGLDNPEQFVMPEHVTWRSTDGLEIPGLLLTPKEVVLNGHPVLVHIHGGVTSHSLQSWDPMAQYFVARGWAVIKPNYRGSMGYGRAFMDCIDGAWGSGDLQDNVTSVNVLRDRKLVDERRVVAWGSSAGGYATLCCVTMAPGAFSAGVELAGLSDLVAFHYDTDRYARFMSDSTLGPLSDNYDLWVERSPITHAADAAGPLLILQGSHDRRVPPSQSESMVAALQKAGKVVEHHTYEGEGHSPRASASIRDYIVRMEDFLTRHVLDR